MPIALRDAVSILQEYPSLYSQVNVEDVLHFIKLATLVKPYLWVARSAYDGGPVERLPAYIHGFIVTALNLEDDVGKLLWEAFKFLIWSEEWSDAAHRELGSQYIPYFLQHGTSRGLTFHCLLPPVKTCLDPNCVQYSRGLRDPDDYGRRRELTEPCVVPVTVFSRDFGPLPATSISLYCRGCKTRYYHNYYVHESATLRTYYVQHATYVHTVEHVFVDKETCSLFTSMMASAWTSGTNCAHIYNETIGKSAFEHLLPTEHPTRLKLDQELVWNSLFLYWLLDYHYDHGMLLELDHAAPSQSERLAKGLRQRNLRLVGTGQEQWNHACDACCWIDEDNETGASRAVRSVVVDGVTVGRPCCGVHDCMDPLPSVKHRFCSTHHEQNFQCSVTSCSDRIEPGFQTCKDPDHRRLELHVQEENKSMFQLKRRLERAGALPGDAASEGSLDNTEVEVELVGAHSKPTQCTGKQDTGNRKVKARFGRRRTHNEELCVASCGVILGRATFYGSEAPNGVRTFMKRLFPTKRSLPQVIWHDNNCQIQAMLQHPLEAEDKAYFEQCAMPVDVFHFKSKHKETDVDCNKHCNPAKWKDLITKDGRWRFNSSAAEQVNAWFGKFQAITREMEAIRYDFFLDEMVLRRNRTTIEGLQARGLVPYNIPRSYLLS